MVGSPLSRHGALLVLILSISLEPQSVLSQCVAECVTTDQSGQWESMLTASNIDANSAQLTWSPDDVLQNTQYTVDFKNFQSYMSAQVDPISGVTFLLSNLVPSTNYDVRVCRAVQNNTLSDNCGGCTLCVRTQGPPSVPQGVIVSSIGSETLLVIWNDRSGIGNATVGSGMISNYTVNCTAAEGASPDPRVVPFQAGSDGSYAISFINQRPNTSFTCSVRALNMFGSSPAATAKGSTLPRSSAPGALLMHIENQVDYVHITADSIGLDIPDARQNLFTTSDTINGMDYNFYQHQLYLSTTNGTERAIKRLQLQVSSGNQDRIVLEADSSPTAVLALESDEEASLITIDYLNNEVFYVVVSPSAYRIMRVIVSEDGSLGTPYCAVSFNTSIINIIVDPVHGFFYWGTSTAIYRVSLSSVRATTTVCPTDLLDKVIVLTNPSLTGFTIEPEEAIYFIGNYTCPLNDMTTPAVLSTSIDIGGRQFYNSHLPVSGSNQIDSFTLTPILSVPDSDVLVFYPNEDIQPCNQPPRGTNFPITSNATRMYRPDKQPLPVPPGPPSDITIRVTDTTAIVRWNTPITVGEFYSADAFNSWNYTIRYCTQDLLPEECVMNRTPLLSITLLDLRAETRYFISVSAIGPGGEEREIPEQLVFTTKGNDFSDAFLLVAAESGVLRSTLTGEETVTIGGDLSGESNSIAHDYSTDAYYWAIVGGQANIYEVIGAVAGSTPSPRYTRRDQPFALDVDWVSKRLFWIEDGEGAQDPLRALVGSLPEDAPGFKEFSAVPLLQASTLDPINGIFFWADPTNIMTKTLSGLDLGVCHTPPNSASSLAVDVQRRQLFWLMENDDTLSINQMEYNSTGGCADSSIVAHDLSLPSFSSSSTVLAYGSNTLFFSNRDGNTIFTISSDFSSIGPGQTLAIDMVEFGPANPVTEIRDISVSSPSLQSQPGTLDFRLRGLEALTPGPPISPPIMDPSSTTSNIVIRWGAASPLATVAESPLFYRVNYILVRSSPEETITGSIISEANTPTVTLTGQQANTEVSVSVTTFSLWSNSRMSVSGSFTSLPDRPTRVNNVRAYVFRPTTDSNNVTALISWDQSQFASTYRVQIFTSSGTEIPNLYLPQDNSNTYTVFANHLGFNTFPLVMGETYTIRVFATNQAGDSPMSVEIMLTVNEPNYPQQVLALDLSGSQYVGEDVGINQDLGIPSPGPIAVDTIRRIAYWYTQSDNLIYSRSLGSGDLQPLLTIPTNEVVLSLAYDWIGQSLFMLRVDTATSRIRILKVNVFIDGDESVEDVFPDLQDTISDPTATAAQLVMNPFTGFIYWTETSSNTDITRLCQLNLRIPGSTSSTSLSAASRRRRKRRRRQTDLTAASLSSALAQDPLTGNLYISDINTGNILSCAPSEGLSCNVIVDRTTLVVPNGVQDIGLPATHLALNEERLYWSNANTTGLFAVDLTDTNTLIVDSISIIPTSISTLSPGQQVLPAIQECLSPVYSVNQRAIILIDEALRVRTNTTITLSWTTSSVLPTSTIRFPTGINCSDIVFSIPQPTFTIEVELSMVAVPELSDTTREQSFVLENLIPHSAYQIRVGISNQYTIRDFPTQNFNSQVDIQTLAGVPSPPTGLTALVTGTASIMLQWDEPSSGLVRGNDTIYCIIFQNGNMTSNVPMLNLIDSSLILRGAIQTIQVIINNGVLNSAPTPLTVRLWELLPPPIIVTTLNTSLDINVTLPESTSVQSVAMIACVSEDGASPGDNGCSCTDDMVEELEFTPVAMSMIFNIPDLVSFTLYCVQVIGNYTTEITGGIGLVARTASGVPDAPIIVDPVVGNMLNWSMPESHGSDIMEYVITAWVSSNREVPPETYMVGALPTTFDLSRADSLVPKLEYEVIVSAINEVGTGPASKAVPYTSVPEPSPSILSVPIIAGVSTAGAGVLAIILIICVIICFAQCRSSKRELHSLSYMYGPDHELNNLRDAHRNGQASNPHYTWSREDYVCTDDDLNLLSKFPRTNLKLENFIDRGEFGEVFQGTAMDILGESTGPTPVAVKTLRKNTTIDEQRKFLSEAALMANFNHPNIVKVLGVCVDNDPVYIIMELMPGGDLLKFLREAKMDHGPTLLTLPEQIQVAIDVAHGCHYLELQHFIHRDIAARNCLVSSRGADRVVKIGDFGLAKDLYSSDYYQVEGQRKLPVRWMAPEALLQGKFTVESDIWSYGVLLWEIFSLGNQPYPGRINQEVLQFVTGGGRLDQPDKCPSRIYHLMQNCWKGFASDRSHFEKILSVLDNYLTRLRRPDSVYNSDTESDEDAESNHQRQNSGKPPARTPSIRSGIMNLARSGSMKFRNSFRRHTSVHKREDHAANSQEDDFRERGPF